MRGKLGVIFAMGLALALVGCGYSCEDFCEDGAACPGSTINPEDCTARCQINLRLNEDMGCDDEFRTMLDCVGEMKNTCEEELGECGGEALAWTDCKEAYCYDNPYTVDCESYRPEVRTTR